MSRAATAPPVAALSVSVLDGVRWPPCPAPFNLAAHALAQAPRLGSKCALEIVGPARVERWRYDALAAAVLSAGGGLRAAGMVELSTRPGGTTSPLSRASSGSSPTCSATRGPTNSSATCRR